MLTYKVYQYAGYEIDGAIDYDTQQLYISFPCIQSILNYEEHSTRQKFAGKSFKAFVGKGFQLGKKVESILNKQEADYHAQGIKRAYVFASAFLQLVLWEAVENHHPEAVALVSAGFVTDFMQSSLSSFGINLDQEMQEKFRKLVRDRITGFKRWMSIICERYCTLRGFPPQAENYKFYVTYANQRLFNQPHFNGDRNHMTEEQMELVLDFEKFLARLARKNPQWTPFQLLQEACDMYGDYEFNA